MKIRKIIVLVVSSLGPRPYVGGIENVIDTLLNSKLKDTFDFMIFDTYRKPNPKRNFIEKILFSIKLFISCLIYIHKIKPDIVHIHFCSRVDFWKHAICLFASKILKIKTVFHCHGGSFDNVYLNYTPILKNLVRLVFKLPNYIVALSSYWLEFLSNLACETKIKILPNPIDCTELSGYSISYKEIVRKNIILVGSVGRRKGHFDAVKAMPDILKEFPDVQMLFAGAEEDSGAIEELTKISYDAGIINNIHFLGSVAGAEKLKLFGSAYMVILPSYGENMPISVMEGMAAHRAVIASSVGAIPELFDEEEYGLLIKPGDWKELALKIISLLRNSEYAAKIGEKGYCRVKELYDVNEILKLHIHLYYELLK
jgi:glycosyltransferase involved in cell wall biosynthesis